jgi:hypothetical protein
LEFDEESIGKLKAGIRKLINYKHFLFALDEMQKLDGASVQLQTLSFALSLAVMDQDKVLLLFAFVGLLLHKGFELSC